MERSTKWTRHSRRRFKNVVTVVGHHGAHEDGVGGSLQACDPLCH